eukprot:scaffold103998_cov69-Phaeocystis_antarctica.AAC.4
MLYGVSTEMLPKSSRRALALCRNVSSSAMETTGSEPDGFPLLTAVTCTVIDALAVSSPRTTSTVNSKLWPGARRMLSTS